MSSAKTAQFITLAELIKQSNPSIYILNTSNPKGNITFEVADGMGGKTSILIPSTWVAVDLTTQAPKENILNNPQFRKLLAAGLIKLPSESYMNSMRAKEGYSKEESRVYNVSSEMQNSGDMSPEARAVVESTNVSGFVLNLVSSDDIDESEAVNSVRLQEDAMTKEDLTYLVNNCKHAKVKALAAEILAEKE